jgi:hypothetical protein
MICTACSADAPTAPAPPPDLHLVGEPVALGTVALTTFDNSGQVVHPDIAIPPADALGGQPWLAITPYPWGNASYENPSLFVGDGTGTWSIPAGVTNPIVRPADGYLSDPDMLWNEEARELRLYYRQVIRDNAIMLVTSRDGVQWSAPRVVVRAPSHQAVSPTVVRRSATEWLMWTVNAGDVGCSSAATTVQLRRSTDGVSWTGPESVKLSQRGVFPWHIDVQWLPSLGEYWAMFNGKTAGSCTTDALYLATSTDGVTWRTFASPVLRRGAIPEFADIVYRATFSYDSDRDLVSLWHSGARHTSRGYEWHAAFERRRRSDLFDTIGRTTSATFVSATALSPQLTNATAP